MLIQSINNMNCANRTAANIAKILKDLQGSVTVLASTPGAPPQWHVTEVVTATLPKNTALTEFDLEKTQDGKIIVSELGAGGVFHGTALRVGMSILSVNNVDCMILSHSAIIALLQQTEDDTWTILARRPELTPGLIITQVMRREKAGRSIGLGIGRSRNGRVIITSIKDGSLASSTRIIPGMEFLMINNINCVGMGTLECAKMLSDAVGLVTIVAAAPEKDPMLNPPSYVTATLDESAFEDGAIRLAHKKKKLSFPELPKVVCRKTRSCVWEWKLCPSTIGMLPTRNRRLQSQILLKI
jgi:hypothetical protein